MNVVICWGNHISNNIVIEKGRRQGRLKLPLIFNMYYEGLIEQEIVFKKDKATLHVISKRYEDSKLFQINLKKIRLQTYDNIGLCF